MKPKRTRTKDCEVCGQGSSVLYRIQVDTRGWVFACPGCQKKFKSAYPETYRYGGTWKANKRH